LGDMQPWERVRLGDIVTIKHGWPFKTEFISEDLAGGPIVVNIGNFRYSGGFRFESTRTREYRGNYPEEYRLQSGDILLVMTCQTSEGEILGIPARVLNDGRVYLHNQRLGKVLIVRPDRVEPDYLYWLFLWREFNHELYVTASGTKILHTAPKRIEGFEFGLPSVGEQRIIAKILNALEKRIELNQQTNRTLEAIGQAIFKRWFVDFGFPNEEGKPYKSSGGEMVYNEELDEEIPTGWQVKPIDETADFLNGLALQRFPSRDGEEYLPVIKIRELRQGITEASDKANLDMPKEYVVNDGDILFSWSGSLEVVIWGFGKGALNQHLFKVTSSKYPKWFFYYWILHYLPEFRQIAAGKATTMGHIQRHHLTASQVAIPDDKTLERMDQVLGPILERTSRIRIETRLLSEIRDSLLPKLMSGKIRVPFRKKI
jgi:type I restriction enzyme S subunit